MAKSLIKIIDEFPSYYHFLLKINSILITGSNFSILKEQNKIANGIQRIKFKVTRSFDLVFNNLSKSFQIWDVAVQNLFLSTCKDLYYGITYANAEINAYHHYI